MLGRTLTCCLLSLASTCAVQAEDRPEDNATELQFIDLRLGGGLHDTRLSGADLTLMAGNIGDKTPHTVDTWSDAGIVLGVRAMWDTVQTRLSGGTSDYKARLVGGELLLGIGLFVDEADHLEADIGYGKGMTNDATLSGVHRNGSYSELHGELAYYHTFIQHFQLGVTMGYSYDKLKIKGTGQTFSGKANGLDLTAVIGYRF